MTINCFDKALVIACILLFANTSCSLLINVSDECDVDTDCKDGHICVKHLCIINKDSDSVSSRSADFIDTDAGTDAGTDSMDDPSDPIPADAGIVGSIFPRSGDRTMTGRHYDRATIRVVRNSYEG